MQFIGITRLHPVYRRDWRNLFGLLFKDAAQGIACPSYIAVSEIKSVESLFYSRAMPVLALSLVKTRDGKKIWAQESVPEIRSRIEVACGDAVAFSPTLEFTPQHGQVYPK